MRESRFKRSFPFRSLVLSGMVVLLASVAVLQYRWTTEISAATEIRIGTELESLMMKWRADLYGELSAICVAMQVGPDAGARDTWNDYLQRYVEWSSAPNRESRVNTYTNPDLVREIYIWDTNPQTNPQLFRMIVESKRIEISGVPQELQNLLTRLRANSASLSLALRAWQLPVQQGQRTRVEAATGTSLAEGNTNTGWQFDASIPAIVHPIFQRDPKAPASRTTVDWMVIVLNLDTIQKRVMPELATRYFGDLDGLDYNVAVVMTGKSPHTIYSSKPGFGGGDLGAVDATMSIFGSSPGSMGGHFWQTVRPSRALGSGEWPGRGLPGTVWFPTIAYETQPDSWVLALQRRDGPLQAVVTRVRQRNLTISALVLLLLAVNMGLVTVASFRAQNFAKLQMDFVASVSHELRTPLTAIFSAGENIKDGVVSGTSSLVHYGSIVVSQARQLMDHVDRILLFASIRSGKDRYNLRPLPVAEILQRVRKNTAGLLSEPGGYTIEEQVEPGLPCVLGDLLAVSGCLENLIANAIKYGGSDRRIRISATLHEIRDHGKEIWFSVEDHGIGISSSELKHIFEPFYRSPEVTAAQIHGTGLGLSLAKHLAEAMGGRLSVASELGVGSVFTLHLPTTAPPECELSTVSSKSDEVIRQ